MSIEDPLVHLQNEWNYVKGEYQNTKSVRDQHKEKSLEYHNIQRKCKAEMDRISKLLKSVNREMKQKIQIFDEETLKFKNEVSEVQSEVAEQFSRLPGRNGFYLKLIVGDLNLTLPTNELKRKYKEDYEKWKLNLSFAILAFSVLNLIYFHRLAEALHLFLLLWFYCTLTVRESILVVNGSRIRGWWVMHHYISAFLVGVHIIWPTASDGYDRFRNLTVWFSLLVSLVQALQYTYQSGLLYRLRSLGKVKDLHLTIDGIQRYMFNDRDSLALWILTPALLTVYLVQFYLAAILFKLWIDGGSWHVIIMCICYFTLGVGNSMTLVSTLLHKEKKRKASTMKES